MKQITFLIFTFICTLSFGQTEMLITGVFDGPLSGGRPKFVEFAVLEDIADLSIFGFGAANNGGGSDGQEYTFSGSATAGDFIYIASDSAGFNSYFGFLPNDTAGAANINGDDAIELFKNAVVIDLYGDVNTDGTGENWDYLDGWAYRENGSEPSAVFDSSEWVFSGTNANDGETSNSTATTPFPLGTYTNTVLSNFQATLDEFQVSIYPNPTTLGYTNINTEFANEIDVEVYNLAGQKVLETTVEGEILNVTSLETGMYLVKLIQDKKARTIKLAVE